MWMMRTMMSAVDDGSIVTLHTDGLVTTVPLEAKAASVPGL